MRVLRRLWNAVRPGRVERDIAREMSFHLAERIDELRAAGHDEEEAIRRARRQFGNPTLQAERTRDVDVAGWLDALGRNLRYGVRTLVRAPAFTLTAVLTLALGIGANAAVFSALDAVLLRPLPFPQADELVSVNQRQEPVGQVFIAPVRLADWDRLNTTFQGITGYYVEDVSETSGDLPERIRRAFVAPRFFEVLRVPPALGRSFTAEDHRSGSRPGVIISDRYWRRRFNADPLVLQQQVRIGTAALPIVGVMPPTFRFTDRDVDLWAPSAVDAPYAQSRSATWYTGLGRLRPGVTPAQARDNLAAVQARLGAQYPETDRAVDVDVLPLKRTTVGEVGASLWLLFAAVSVLLLIACTNIAALLLSRGAHRQHEVAIRLSLGASRRTIAVQLLTETALLAAAGGLIGVLVAAAAGRALQAAAADLPRIDEMGATLRVLLYTGVTTVAMALLCGVLPAVRGAWGVSTTGDAGARTRVSAGTSLQWLLVGAQVALSVTLLAAAGLLARSFHELSRVDPGFDASRVLTFRVSGTWSETSARERLLARVNTTIDQLRTLPGVEAVSTTGWALPGVPEQWETTFALAEAAEEVERTMVAEGRAVSPEYFATMRIPLLSGEVCRRHTGDTAVEVMVNRAFADRYLTARTTPVGLHLAQIQDGKSVLPASRIAGVVGDARERGLDRAPGPTVYWCTSAPNPTPYFLVRTRDEPLALATTVRVTMKSIEPLRSVYDVAPLEERLGDAFAENRLRATIITLFAATAMTLACVGLYSTVSYVVSLRRREIGLRLAVGATRADIVRHFLWQGLRVAGAACLCGLAIAVASGHALRGMLFGVTPSDPLTLSSAGAAVLAVAAAAALVPATRAALLEPMQVLREE